ncbi:MAG: hypothetical protein OXQ90_12340 [Gammaproteobacteria bacterium]|nr:hypothetical protein [Gammaproteobacteria bacterium]
MASPSSTMPAFDTHKAVKALRHAGFDDVQAEAVVDQINGAITENLVFKADLAETERNLAVRIDTTKEDLRATVAALATKEDPRNYATKDDFANLITKEDLAQFELRMTAKMEALTGKMLRYWGGGLALVVALIKGLDLLVG